MNNLICTCKKNNFTNTLLLFLSSIIAISLTSCDAPAGSLDEQPSSVEAGAGVTAESMGYEITMTDLGTFNGEGDSYATDINDNGKIVGAALHP